MKRPLLSVKQVQTYLNVSRRTVYYWVKKGILKPIEIGGLLRFHPEDIDALIEKHRSTGTHRKKRILAIDDDILVRESLKRLLEREGFEVTIASSGQEALRLVSQEVFDLVITDVRMAEMNGIETIKAIREERARFRKAPLPEVVLTAYDDEPVREEARCLGVRDFVIKPFQLDKFVETIRKNVN